MSLALKFPNARLLIHNLIALERLSGAEALARGACEYGVICIESLDDPALDCAIKNCDCCAAAQSILRQYFRSSAKPDYAEQLESAWNSVLARLSGYRCRLNDRQNQNGQPKAEIKGAPDCEHACANLAPVIFDFMLQEVHRHS
jgi:hypothetical protein